MILPVASMMEADVEASEEEEVTGDVPFNAMRRRRETSGSSNGSNMSGLDSEAPILGGDGKLSSLDEEKNYWQLCCFSPSVVFFMVSRDLVMRG